MQKQEESEKSSECTNSLFCEQDNCDMLQKSRFSDRTKRNPIDISHFLVYNIIVPSER